MAVHSMQFYNSCQILGEASELKYFTILWLEFNIFLFELREWTLSSE